MRIQHNIMAMNAYRNYTNNVSAMKSNLEKLSSGYKINRAGDDAAGLAISEKMRAQITGLETAQKNAKDGISLVQTAEGALTEVHDMLNRMVELATQSANGTYDNTTDRAQLQKEMDQLKAEINRIADSANFNGIKLLDGSMDAEDVVTVNDPTFIGQSKFEHYNHGVNGTEDKPQFHKEATGEAKSSFTVGFNDLKIDAKEDENGNSTAKVQLLFGRPVNTDGGDTDPGDGSFPATYDSGIITLTGKQAGESYTGADVAKQIYDAIGAANDGKYTIKLDIKTDMSAENATAADATSIEYDVTLNDDGTLTFTMSDDGYNKAVSIYNANNDAKDDNDILVGKGPFEVDYTACVFTTDPSNRDTSARFVGTVNTNVGGPSTGKQLAQTTVDLDKIFTDTTVKDGAGIKVGDTSYVFAATDDTFNAKYGDDVKVVDIRDLVGTDGKTFKADAELGGTSGVKHALSRLTQAGKDNEMFSIETAKDSGNRFGVTFSEKQTYSGDADLTKMEGLQKEIQYFTGIRANVDTKAATGKALTLQIGDTADSYNQLKVNIKDMHAASLGLDKISIADQDSAAAAVDAIKAAINKVSDVRGTLGATQNRLDHTINNLSVMTENIQDAESTIRDVDVAEEMMAYTKNNILIQSAQAMLAQANQVPQGVLQLLQ